MRVATEVAISTITPAAHGHGLRSD